MRATCTITGISVVVRDGRSQHRNKAIAVERLQTLLGTHKDLQESLRKQKQNHLHHQLERGNPVRRFKGASFNATVCAEWVQPAKQTLCRGRESIMAVPSGAKLLWNRRRRLS